MYHPSIPVQVDLEHSIGQADCIRGSLLPPHARRYAVRSVVGILKQHLSRGVGTNVVQILQVNT